MSNDLSSHNQKWYNMQVEEERSEFFKAIEEMNKQNELFPPGKDLTAEQCAGLLGSYGGFNARNILRQLLMALNREKKLRDALNELIKESNQYRMNVNGLMRDVGGFAETIQGKSSQFHQRLQEADEALSV